MFQHMRPSNRLGRKRYRRLEFKQVGNLEMRRAEGWVPGKRALAEGVAPRYSTKPEGASCT